jgi:organic hydroperoxide reductase OsmC/OhrA
MRVRASVENWDQHHAAAVELSHGIHELNIPPAGSGHGSSINGGQLLCLAAATCYCNDIYREAKQRGIEVLRVNVDVEAEFGGPGEPAKSMVYRARVAARAGEQAIRDLMVHTDKVAEIQNTLRRGMDVRFEPAEVIVED